MFANASSRPRCAASLIALATLALTACTTTPPPASAPPPNIEAPAPPPVIPAPTPPASVPFTALTSLHCLRLCPSGYPANDEIVERHLYILANNPSTKFADWVAYVVTPGVSGSEGRRRWRPDPALSPADTLEEGDYTDAHDALGIDLGHQAPLATFASSPDWAETNFLSNITPQNSNLNRGRWARLERAERTVAEREHTNVYVITGPLYERAMAPLPHADEPHRVPSGYWKVVALADGRSASFIFDNAPGRERFCADQHAIVEIERRSGLEIVANDNGAAASLAPALGC